MSEALIRATKRVGVADLPRMVLGRAALPPALSDFLPSRSGPLDNETLAQQGLPGSSAERFRTVGRLTGYLQEFLAPAPEDDKIPPGYDLAAATVAHLFGDASEVLRWMDEVFLNDFESSVDQEIHPGQSILLVERVPFHGFADTAVGLRVVQSSPDGPVSSTVIDFRVGRVLGVAYVATMGNYERHELVQRLGRELERNIIRVVLEARPGGL